MKVSNEEIWDRTISAQVRARRLKWPRHVLRISVDQNPKTAKTWTPEGKRWRKTLWRTISKLENISDWRREGKAEVAAEDSVSWRRRIDAPILNEKRKTRDLTFSHSTIKTEASCDNIKSLLLKKYDTVWWLPSFIIMYKKRINLFRLHAVTP